uniref:Uncharacterized protein n=1 Tax=Ignisphaera aggregans TaxID=334771 RepID=A0A7C2ZQE3_9CREN
MPVIDRKTIIRFIYKLGDTITLAVDLIVIIATSVLIILSSYILFKDVVVTGGGLATEELQIIVNDIFLLIIFSEIIRSVIIAHRKPEMYIVGVAEIGFVVTVRELIVAVITKTTLDLVLAAVASLLLAAVLWVLRVKMLPSIAS